MDSLTAFQALDIRVGTILNARPLADVRKPSFQLTVDFGSAGVRQSAAQITDLYSPTKLIGMRVLGVVNLPPKRIGPFVSEVLILGLPDESGKVVLLTPERPVPNGGRVF